MHHVALETGLQDILLSDMQVEIICFIGIAPAQCNSHCNRAVDVAGRTRFQTESGNVGFNKDENISTSARMF